MPSLGRTAWAKNCSSTAHQWNQATKENGHGHKKLFFGNIPASKPEAQFLELVQSKVGDVAMVKQSNPGLSCGRRKGGSDAKPRS